MEAFLCDGIVELQTAIERLFRETSIQETPQCVIVPKPHGLGRASSTFQTISLLYLRTRFRLSRTHFQVTWVCRRFRQVALSTSCIWSGVSSLLPERVLDLHIEWSKEMLLSLVIHHVPGMGSIHSHRLLDATLSLTSRWESFSMLCDLSEI